MQKLKDLQKKIISRKRAQIIRQELEENGGKLVFTNGCFDILHRGHVEYLSKAADLADALMIGLNTDDSVRRLKGENRPVNAEDSRALLLAALQFVDYVVLFDEDTPQQLIEEVIPSILVKGKDYRAAEVVGYEVVTAHGGEVKTIDLVEGYSTTGIINKLKNS